MLRLKKDAVISTGGGAMTFQRNVDAVKNSGKIVFLDADFDVICKRIGNNTNRPLFQDKEKAKEIILWQSQLMKQKKDVTQ